MAVRLGAGVVKIRGHLVLQTVDFGGQHHTREATTMRSLQIAGILRRKVTQFLLPLQNPTKALVQR